MNSSINKIGLPDGIVTGIQANSLGTNLNRYEPLSVLPSL